MSFYHTSLYGGLQEGPSGVMSNPEEGHHPAANTAAAASSNTHVTASAAPVGGYVMAATNPFADTDSGAADGFENNDDDPFSAIAQSAQALAGSYGFNAQAAQPYNGFPSAPAVLGGTSTPSAGAFHQQADPPVQQSFHAAHSSSSIGKPTEAFPVGRNAEDFPTSHHSSHEAQAPAQGPIEVDYSTAATSYTVIQSPSKLFGVASFAELASAEPNASTNTGPAWAEAAAPYHQASGALFGRADSMAEPWDEHANGGMAAPKPYDYFPVASSHATHPQQASPPQAPAPPQAQVPWEAPTQQQYEYQAGAQQQAAGQVWMPTYGYSAVSDAVIVTGTKMAPPFGGCEDDGSDFFADSAVCESATVQEPAFVNSSLHAGSAAAVCAAPPNYGADFAAAVNAAAPPLPHPVAAHQLAHSPTQVPEPQDALPAFGGDDASSFFASEVEGAGNSFLPAMADAGAYPSAAPPPLPSQGLMDAASGHAIHGPSQGGAGSPFFDDLDLGDDDGAGSYANDHLASSAQGPGYEHKSHAPSQQQHGPMQPTAPLSVQEQLPGASLIGASAKR